jgi:hypothetical protein
MSVVAEAKRNWLDQVKADAEELTRERLAKTMPRLQEVAAKIEAQSVPKKATKKGNDN